MCYLRLDLGCSSSFAHKINVLSNITAYGFEFQSLWIVSYWGSVPSRVESLQGPLTSADLSKLRTLELNLYTGKIAPYIQTFLASQVLALPHLESFKLSQVYNNFRRMAPTSGHVNIVKQLCKEKKWPKLRNLKL